MQIPAEYLPYLDGKKLSDELRLTLARRDERAETRLEYLERRTAGKRVLHVGCADHAHLIEDRIRADTWTHKRLTDTAAECLGIDIDAAGIETAHRCGYRNVIECDLIDGEASVEILAKKWDYAIFGEVLEHIDDPVFFLNTFLIRYGAAVERIIVTVPNAFHLNNFYHALRHQEWVNTDHRYWFTPYTLAKVATMAGFDVVGYAMCVSKGTRGAWRRYFKPKSILKRRYPLLRPIIAMELAPAARGARFRS